MFLFDPPNVEKMLAQKNVKGLVKALGYSKDKQVVQSAFRALVSLGKDSVDSLILELSQPDPEVRRLAIEALSQIGAPTVKPIIDLIRKDVPELVRQGSMTALIKIGVPGIIYAILELRPIYERKNMAIATDLLLGIGPMAVPELISIMTDDHFLDFRIPGASILKKMGPAAIPQVLAVVENEDQADLIQLVEVLDQWGWKPDNSRAASVYWIVKNRMQEAATIQEYAKRLKTYNNDQAVIETAKELGQSGDKLAVPALIEALRFYSDDSAVGAQWCYQSIVEALGRLGDSSAIDPIFASLDSPLVSGRWDGGDLAYPLCYDKAIEALAYLGDRRVLQILLKDFHNTWDHEINHLLIAQALIIFYKNNQLSISERESILRERDTISQFCPEFDEIVNSQNKQEGNQL